MRGRTWHAGDRRRSRIGSARDRLGPVGWAGGTDPARLKPFATRDSVMDRGGAGQLDRARPVLLASRVSTVHSGLSRRADVGSWFVAEPRLDVVGQRVAAIGRVELRQHLGPTHLVEVEDRAILGSGSSQLPVPVLAVPIATALSSRQAMTRTTFWVAPSATGMPAVDMPNVPTAAAWSVVMVVANAINAMMSWYFAYSICTAVPSHSLASSSQAWASCSR